MEIKKEKFEKALEELLSKEKGKRNFTQSVELIINFRGIDFSKPENRVNLTIYLPKGRGSKPTKLIFIGDEATTYEAKNLGFTAYTIDEFVGLDEKEIKKLANKHYFVAQPNVISQIAKKFGKILGARGKTPIPLIGNLKQTLERMKNMVKLQTKGKYMPTLQVFVGTEDMSAKDLAENIMTVMDELTKKIPPGNIKNTYVKLTMSKPIKVG